MKAAALAIFLAAAGLCACTGAPPPCPGPDFVPERWFLGSMHSSGTLKPIVGAARGLHVDSDGTALAAGGVRLDQAIRWAGGATDHRFWTMRREASGVYAVTLTEAAGPVAFSAQGPRAHLRYRDRRSAIPLTVEQWMDLQPDGVTLRNVGVIRLLGVPFARLDETIVHDR
jgi:hypothetical protein